MKHDLIALRFAPQHLYEAYAPMEITPTPDLKIRIFMIFKGLSDNWPTTSEQNPLTGEPDLDAGFWRSTIGVTDVNTEDTTIFRVIEWGGAEL